MFSFDDQPFSSLPYGPYLSALSLCVSLRARLQFLQRSLGGKEDVALLHAATVESLFEEEEALLNLHMNVIQENAELLTEEGRLLQGIQVRRASTQTNKTNRQRFGPMSNFLRVAGACDTCARDTCAGRRCGGLRHRCLRGSPAGDPRPQGHAGYRAAGAPRMLSPPACA